MSEPSRSQILREFQELANADNIDNVKVQYRVSGGAPGEQFRQELILPGGDADIELKIKEPTNQGTELTSEKKLSLSLNLVKKRSLFKQIALGVVAGFSTSEKPIFLPDSVVAALTIQIEDKEPTTVHFLADEIDRRIQNKPIPQEIADAVKQFEKMIQMRSGEI